ncbi:MAG: sugar ABC transporter permease [Actinomycetota bacterium]|nr:sugar ABC transporter permease [Actinomycetota bacterium]
MSARETRAAYAFISPWIVGFVFFTAGPVLATLFLSMTEYDVLSSPTWTGLDNYRQALHDPDTAHALKNTGIYALMYVPSSVVLGLALAMLLQRAGRATGVMRTVMYLPVMTPPVATAVLFLLLLNGQNGLINEVLGAVGLPTPYWTSDPQWIKPGLVILSLWSIGSVTIILYAALQEVPESLTEAARVDGAGPWRRLWHVTLPMISPALLFVLVINTIASMQLFTEAYTMYFGTVTTNPPDEALFYVIYLFEQGFRFLHMGYASALAWLLFVVILAITLVQLWASRRMVFYRSE